MIDYPAIEDNLGYDDLDARRKTAQRFAPKSSDSWKTGLALQVEIEWFVQLYGLDHCALLTLLFVDPSGRRPITPAEAQLIFKRAAHRLFPRIFKAYIAVLDFHRSGAVHLHVVAAMHARIRDGWNFAVDDEHRAVRLEVKKEKRRMTAEELKLCRKLSRQLTTNLAIKQIFKQLRDELPKLGFPSRYPFELKPIRKPEALARYLGGRYRESRARRDLRPVHSRCVRYSANYPRCVDKKLRISPVGPSAGLYRLKKAAVGAAFGVENIGEMIIRFGDSWEHDFGDILHPVNRWDSLGFFSEQLGRLRARAAAYAPYNPLAPLRSAEMALPPPVWTAPVPPPTPIPFHYESE